MTSTAFQKFNTLLVMAAVTAIIAVGCADKSDKKKGEENTVSNSQDSANIQSSDDFQSSVTKINLHPLEPLSSQEIEETVRILKQSGKISAASRFASISLDEPDKQLVYQFDADTSGSTKRSASASPEIDVPAPPRKSFSVVYEIASNRTFEAVVDLRSHQLISYAQAAGQAQVPQDVTNVRNAVRSDARWQEAMKKRGIANLDDVYIAVWASAYLPDKESATHKTLKAVFYRRGKSGNAYLRPIEGVVAEVDAQASKVLKVTDDGVIPVSPEREVSNVVPPVNGPDRDNFNVQGHEVTWKNWRFRFGVTPREGLVLYTVSYNKNDDGSDGVNKKSVDARTISSSAPRPILYRASVSELCVPYADPSAGWSFRDAFDVGQFGLGSSASSLQEESDAPAKAKFFDATIANEVGTPVTRKNVVALYERDGGILWRHFDRPNQRNYSRRGKDLVLSFITTLSNYDYCFNWIFHEDGTLEMETGMTGIMLAKGVMRSSQSSVEHGYSHAVEPSIDAVHHQHFFCFRLDLDVDGAQNNSLIESNGVAIAEAKQNPYGNAFCVKDTKLRSEKAAQRLLNLNVTRRWKVVNESMKNELGQPTGYMLIPGENSTPYANPSSYVRQRAGFINAHVWGTAYDSEQMYAAGPYPFNSYAGEGLPTYVKDDSPLEKRDIVLWYTMGITHTPRPEEWPIMPVHRSGFKLAPNCFFAKNPAVEYLETKGTVEPLTGSPNGR